MKITPADFIGVAGIVPTPATPDGGRWQTENSVNFAETERMIELVVDGGIEIIMTTGTFGECASLTEPELRDFVACVVGAVRGRRPVFAGLTTLNTRDTIRRGSELVALGADGLFLGRPMWLSLDDAGIVGYYSDIAEALPGVPLVIYDNPLAFKGKISREAYRALAKIPEIIAAKHVGGPSLIEDARIVGQACRVLPLSSNWYEAAVVEPDLVRACWSGGVACAPAPHLALSRAIAARDWPLAKEIGAKCLAAESPMFADGNLQAFMDYSIPVGHCRFAAAGLIDPGPARPPYQNLPDRYREGGLECGRRWAALQAEYAGDKMAAAAD